MFEIDRIFPGTPNQTRFSITWLGGARAPSCGLSSDTEQSLAGQQKAVKLSLKYEIWWNAFYVSPGFGISYALVSAFSTRKKDLFLVRLEIIDFERAEKKMKISFKFLFPEAVSLNLDQN